MRIAVVGANGQLGQDLLAAIRAEGGEPVELNHDALEIADRASVAAALAAANAGAVVNTAAMHHVEQCEADPAKAYAVNALGARHLAQECQARGAVLVHVSTDYVFDGAKRAPYVETDAPLPMQVYGNTKLAGEHYARTECASHFVVRTSAIFGKAPCRAKGGNNFVTTMLKAAAARPEVRVVDSEIVSPTYTADLAKQILALIASRKFGLYHGASRGACSWHAFAKEIFALAGVTTKLSVAGPNEFPAKTPRPTFSALDNAALRAAGLDVMRPWQEALRVYLGEIGALASR